MEYGCQLMMCSDSVLRERMEYDARYCRCGTASLHPQSEEVLACFPIS